MELHKKQFHKREWTKDTPGEYDQNGFFVTPNGSFWDPDYVYFNREGYDSHQGYYDNNGIYVPGPTWDSYNEWYPDELHDEFDDMFDDDYNQVEDDGYGNYLDDDLIDEEKYLEVTHDIDKININKKEYDNVQYGASDTFMSNQPQAQEKKIPQEEKKELVSSKPKSGLAKIVENIDKNKSEEEKKNIQKKQAKK